MNDGFVPFATLSLVLLNVLTFIFGSGSRVAGDDRDVHLQHVGLVPDSLSNAPLKRSPTLVTSMFSHASAAHLLFNMYALLQFGPPVESMLGPGRFFALYLTSGITANALYTLIRPRSKVPLVGASGAIAGISAAYYLAFRDVQSMRDWLVTQIVGLVLYSSSAISYLSHLLGFATGTAMFYVLGGGGRHATPR